MAQLADTDDIVIEPERRRRVGWEIAIVLALLLNQKIRGRSIIRVLIFVPYIISEVIVGIGWGLMLQTSGSVNGLLDSIGLGAFQKDWLSDPSIAIWSLMVIISWKYIGFAVILFLAGLQSIPDELFEAAAIDGAGVQHYHHGIVEVNPTVAEMDAAQAEARAGRPAPDPHIELCFPTVHDPSLAPEGQHVVTIDVPVGGPLDGR